MLRSILSGLFIFACVAAMVVLVKETYPDDQWPWWVLPLLIIGMLISMVLALILFRERDTPVPWASLEEHIAQLEANGLIQRDHFKATRAFSLDEFEDEGCHYYIELEDGRVLYLNGQYLYDYDPIENDDNPEEAQVRTFPCTEFEIVRHKTEEYVICLECKGQVLEPEVEAPHFTKVDFKANRIPEDGTILSESYDKLKQERMGNPPTFLDYT